MNSFQLDPSVHPPPAQHPYHLQHRCAENPDQHTQAQHREALPHSRAQGLWPWDPWDERDLWDRCPRHPELLAEGSVVGSAAIQMDFKVPQRPNLHAGKGSGCPKHSIFRGYWSVSDNQQENSSMICLHNLTLQVIKQAQFCFLPVSLQSTSDLSLQLPEDTCC